MHPIFKLPSACPHRCGNSSSALAGVLVSTLLGLSHAAWAGEDQPPAAPPKAEDRPKSLIAEKTGASSLPASGTNWVVTVDGEKFSRRVVRDEQQNGLVVCVFQAPEKWRDQSRVVWRYDYNSNPVGIWSQVENPDNEEALYSFPPLLCFWLRPETGYYQPGQNVGGLICARPMNPSQTLLAFIRQTRGNLKALQIIGSKELSDLPKVLKLKPAPNQHGVGIKIAYEFKGKPVEEEFYAVWDSVDIPYDGPQGRTWQVNWGLVGLHSFRAPKGTLDGRRAVFGAMVKSIRNNPAWEERRTAVVAYLAEQFNRQLQAGYDSIAAAGRLSRQISANNDAMLASIDRQLAASRTQRSESGGATRTSADHFDDYIRGVETVDDPYWGTSQHSINEKYHWTDGYGSYRNSNDASYNPNEQEKGDWQLMQPSQ
jgi:hypothetical protein